MAAGGSDPYGSTETNTEYEGQKRASPDRTFWRSTWVVIGLAVCLALLVIAIIAWPRNNTDPAPNANPALGIVRETGPATNKQ